MVSIKDVILEKRLRSYQVAGMARNHLGFHVTSHHVLGLAEHCEIKFSRSPAPGESRGAAKKKGRTSAALVARKPSAIVARGLIKLATKLGVELEDEIWRVAVLEKPGAKPA